MDLPKKLLDEYKKQKKIEDGREQKVKSKVHYKRRKLNKEINKYVKECTGTISGKEIDRIGRQHGFHIGSTLFRAD